MKSWSIFISLLAFCLGSLAVNSFSELVIIRQKSKLSRGVYRFTCISNDYRAALVWNNDIRSSPSSQNDEKVRLPDFSGCAIRESNKCIAGWQNSGDWEAVDSAEYPMGPVFDSRWKDFTEFILSKNDNPNHKYVRNVSQSGTVVFSARELEAIHVMLCETKKPSESSCIRITIPTWPNKVSVIRSCSDEETNVEGLSPPEACSKEESYFKHDELTVNGSEWRTFTLTWDKDNRTINVFSEFRIFFKKQFNVWPNINHLFVQSSDAGLIRFHFYKYLRSRKVNITLSSTQFSHTGRNFCVELRVSLCFECGLVVSIVDSHSYRKKIGSIHGNWKIAYGKLPTWQVVPFSTTLLNSYQTYALEIDTIMNKSDTQGWWAIDSFRECQPVGSPKYTVIDLPEFPNSTSHSVPIVGCQSLSYTPSAVVKSDGPITYNLSSSLRNCGPGRVGPYCVYQCNGSCLGTSVCDRSGCICAPGFKGSDCDEHCPDGYYGYNCQETCGSCKFGNCNKITGSCNSCKDFYLPPNCETMLRAPTAYGVTATTAKLYYPLDVNTADIYFRIKTETTQWSFLIDRNSRTIRMHGYDIIQIPGLRPSTKYWVQAIVATQDTAVNSPTTSFITRCPLPSKPSILYAIPREKGSVTLTWYYYPRTRNSVFVGYKTKVKLLSTSLRNNQSWEFPISPDYMIQTSALEYSWQTYLQSSSNYRLSVQTIDSCGASPWKFVDYRVPASPGFDSEEKLEVKREASSLTLKLPSIVNETLNTVVTVVVKGSPTCASSPVSDYIKGLVNMTGSEKGWVAATFHTPESRTAPLKIGEVTNDGNSGNCHIINPEETYMIMVVVLDQLDRNAPPAVMASSPMYPIVIESGNRNLIWLVFLFILLICFLALFIWRRYQHSGKFLNFLRRVHLQNIVSYLQTLANFVKSATTCTPQQPQSVQVPAEIDLSGIISTPQTVAWNRYSHSVNIEDFEDYVKESIASGLLGSQYRSLYKGMNGPCKFGSLPENKPKNRYINILPYDNSRVILKKTPDDPYSDYINANYVQGFRKKKAYIAAQGPKPQTVVDFWRMIWQEEALVICMLANVLEGQKIKCEQYWPEVGASKTYGVIVVTTEEVHVLADYTFRSFRVNCNEESRKIEHLHYTGWPDHTVPMYSNSVIAYLRKLQSISIETGPIIVHCSAGVGRTGTIILCDICLRRANAKRTVDVLATFKKLRDCRLNMVDNELQYLFAHLVIAEYLVSPPTELPCNIDLPQAIKEIKEKLPQHIERLCDIAWQDQALNSQLPPRALLPEQLAKNRFPELAPGRSGLVYLERYPTHDSNSDYISTVIVDGLRAKKQYVASQLPLPTTLSDFWRLIAEQRIELVIVLQRPDPDDPTCCDIIPNSESFNPVPFITVEPKTSTDPGKSPKIDELLLTEMFGTKERTQKVTMLTCQDWGLGKNGNPPPPKNLVELWRSSENIHRGKGPTLVLCHDGITGCGLYLALSFLLERMAVEQECDVIFAVRAIRRSRPDFVQSQKQFEYLYDAAVEYTAFFETYSNFT